MIFEFDRYEKKLDRGAALRPTACYEPFLHVRSMSMLYWAEHCVECAAPGCYQSCDLYQPRPDKRCRRFTFGAKKNWNFSSLRGYGVEISFKKWAKLEAYANFSLSGVNSVLWGERLIEAGAPVVNVIGKVMSKVKPKSRWLSATHVILEEVVRYLDRNKKEADVPDAFLLEVYNPATEAIRIQLTIAPMNDPDTPKDSLVQLTASFTTTVVCEAGYSRREIDASLFRAVRAAGRSVLVSMVPEADGEARLVFLSADFVKFARTAQQTRMIKCVILDLDNTLWDGILVEGDSVELRPGIPGLLRHLDERGILLSIASKNDHELAWQKLQELGISDYFLYPQINWGPKSQSIEVIAKRLNLGIDSFAFVDDNSFEIEQVSRAHADIVCINANEISSLLSDPRFQGSANEDSRRRRQLYKEAMVRETAQEFFGANLESFLASCGIILEIAEYDVKDDERVTELVQRTNQLNFSGHKYTREQMAQILREAHLEKYVLKCSDKFGSYGTVGFGLVERSDGLIQVREFMLSCRVQGKYLEKAFFHHLLNHHNPEGVTTLWVNFAPTSRNRPAQQVLGSLGFRACDPSTGRFLSGKVLTTPETLGCDFIQVRCSVPASAGHEIRSPGGHASVQRMD